MSMYRVALVAMLAAATTACGAEDDGTTILPEPTLEDPVGYYGLEACTCYEYAPEDGGPERLGVAVEALTDRFSGTPGLEEHVVRYRRNGSLVREDTFRPTDPDLLLSSSRIRDAAGETLWLFEPPLPYLRYPVEVRQPVTATSTMREFGAETGTEVSFRANYVEGAVDASLDGGATTQTFEDAIRVGYTGLVFPEHFRWFSPENGWVQLELDIEGTRTEWVLLNKRQLGNGCPWDPADPPQDVCGIRNTTTD
jgi:hypothetical protein